jgi:transposase
MGQVLHGSATTTKAIRRAVQHSETSLRQLAKRYGINPKTVAKWKARSVTADQRTGPREPRSTVLSADEEEVVVAFRRHTLLPLDDCLYALQPTIPTLTRSSLHRCFQRHGVSRLPETDGDRPQRLQAFSDDSAGEVCQNAKPRLEKRIPRRAQRARVGARFGLAKRSPHEQQRCSRPICGGSARPLCCP